MNINRVYLVLVVLAPYILVSCLNKQIVERNSRPQQEILYGMPDSIKVLMLSDIMREEKKGYDYYITLEYNEGSETKSGVFIYELIQKEKGDNTVYDFFIANNTTIGVYVSNNFIPIIRTLDIEMYQFHKFLSNDPRALQLYPPGGYGKVIGKYRLSRYDFEKIK